jgi:hypothetical protein
VLIILYTLQKSSNPADSRVRNQRWDLKLKRVGATGFEPAMEIAGTEDGDCSYEKCDMCRAANALHSGRLGWLSLASTDSKLQRVITAWVDLPDPIRRAIMALVASQ